MSGSAPLAPGSAPAAVELLRPLVVVRRPGDPGSPTIRLPRGARVPVVAAPSGRVWGVVFAGGRFVVEPRALVAASRPASLEPAPVRGPLLPPVAAVVPLEPAPAAPARRAPVRGLSSAPSPAGPCPCARGGACRWTISPALESALREIEAGRSSRALPPVAPSLLAPARRRRRRP